jgi:hypothetical protein
MNAQVKTLPTLATGWNPALVKRAGKPMRGYLITGDAGVLGFIETSRQMIRIEELLNRYTKGCDMTAQEVMRTLLNSEDYRSEIYDVILRVHYTEDLTACQVESRPSLLSLSGSTH